MCIWPANAGDETLEGTNLSSALYTAPAYGNSEPSETKSKLFLAYEEHKAILLLQIIWKVITLYYLQKVMLI